MHKLHRDLPEVCLQLKTMPMNLQEESRNGYIVTEKTKKVWQVQLTLLRKLLDVCAKHKLKIWIDGGSLLGAVREKGYIPWDDDIDTTMMRDDYNRLIALANEFEAPFFLQCAQTDRLYPRGHAQLRMDGTAAILPGDAKARVAFHQGIFIDIFVLDGVPEAREERLSAIAETERLSKKLHAYCEYRPPLQVGPYLRRLAYRLKPFETHYERYERSFSRFAISDHPRIYNWTLNLDLMDKRGAIMREWYDETVMLPFEDMMVPAPAGYDSFLKAQYGDYMTPRKEPTTHGQVYFDTEHSYSEVLSRWRKGEIKLF